MSDDEINARLARFIGWTKRDGHIYPTPASSILYPSDCFTASLDVMALAEAEISIRGLHVEYMEALKDEVMSPGSTRCSFGIATATARQRAEAAVSVLAGLEKAR